jgi:hypothetical protein
MLDTQIIPWLLLAGQLGFIMIVPLLSERIPDYEAKDADRIPSGNRYAHQGKRRPVQRRARPSAINLSPIEEPSRRTTRSLRP